jgi:hypothetical protein
MTSVQKCRSINCWINKLGCLFGSLQNSRDCAEKSWFCVSHRSLAFCKTAAKVGSRSMFCEKCLAWAANRGDDASTKHALKGLKCLFCSVAPQTPVINTISASIPKEPGRGSPGPASSRSALEEQRGGRKNVRRWGSLSRRVLSGPRSTAPGTLTLTQDAGGHQRTQHRVRARSRRLQQVFATT